ncbi:MAG: ABC transporter substrate-binding protein [Cardiobacteriaceae bacterium]|nr:ABC transporter substrate-binding protein [Cardiobacteriaceae bacterium]
MLKRRQFIALSTAALAASTLPLHAADNSGFTLWGPPVTPTVLLAVAAQIGEARKIRPFNVQSWRTPDHLRAGLLNKSIEISIVPSYVAANLRAQGQPVLLHNIMTRGLLAIMSKTHPIQELKQLAGQKLVMPFKGDMPDLVLQILSKRAGVDLSDLITYTATPAEAVTLFIQKDFPNALLPEPLASAAILKGKQNGVNIERSFSLDKTWNNDFGSQNGIAQAGLMISESAAKENGAFLAALDKDLLAAVDWVMANSKSAAEIAANYMPAPVPALERSFEHSALCAINAKENSAEILQFLGEMYKLNPKIVGNKMPDDSLFG